MATTAPPWRRVFISYSRYLTFYLTAPGLPLELLEDPQFQIEPSGRAAWLSQWHSEAEWLKAAHLTRYSNGILSLAEELLNATPAADSYLERKRMLRRTDLLVFASDHWNFNVRGFNPGGNHGSLLRPSTHSVFMLAGGADTGIPLGHPHPGSV